LTDLGNRLHRPRNCGKDGVSCARNSLYEQAHADHQETSMRYTVVLEQEGDGGYVVSAPALPGCVSQGDTRADALKNIQEAIALYVEDCRDAGDPVPTEAGKEFVEVEAA
jgi:predicted RNase H-like HicB family nuclease